MRGTRMIQFLGFSAHLEVSRLSLMLCDCDHMVSVSVDLSSAQEVLRSCPFDSAASLGHILGYKSFCQVSLAALRAEANGGQAHGPARHCAVTRPTKHLRKEPATMVVWIRLFASEVPVPREVASMPLILSSANGRTPPARHLPSPACPLRFPRNLMARRAS
ncbi:hypothetical protein PYCCODRAFT_364389 [Trametes coccinea BRFM310]|uniref:Uncharacterized protein n=1 Tax=Trametes coccinea (strain BRFM310) TaxID=1353009 RepID=A0A1Y2J6Q3_TRAC3|nr:hypothetical protein PYCCODRAFT_364389 [Trametes coccinea BRFM310]